VNASPAILALLCLTASGLLDLVFKLYSAQQRSRGMLIFGTGCVWIVLQLAYMDYHGLALSFDSPTLVFGITAAVFVTLSNILLLECLGHLPISMASTIYRLNTIPLVVLAFIFLAENPGLVAGFGILLGLVTVLLLYQPNHIETRAIPHFKLFVVLIITASCLRALYGIFTKAGLNSGADANTIMFFAAIAWCLGGLGYACFRERRVRITVIKLKYMAITGLLVFAIIWLLTTALALGDASLVVPLTNMGFVAAFIFSVLLKLEKLTLRKSLAIASAVLSIVLLTHEI
jgi:drug/metabolite transporter (DMT)-like permease